MKIFSFILKALTAAAAIAALVLIGFIAEFSIGTAEAINNSLIIYDDAGVFTISPPEPASSEDFKEIFRGNTDSSTTFLEIETTGDKIFYKHMVYSALNSLYTEELQLRESAKIISLSEIKSAIGSIPFIAALIPLILFSLVLAFLTGSYIADSGTKERLLTFRFVIYPILLLAGLFAIYLVSSQISIPNSLLPQENIFNLSHYTELYNMLCSAAVNKAAPESLINCTKDIGQLFYMLAIETLLSALATLSAFLYLLICRKQKEVKVSDM